MIGAMLSVVERCRAVGRRSAMRLRCMRQRPCSNHRPWRSVVIIVSTGLLLTMTILVDDHAPPMSDPLSWCGERACPPPGPGVAEVAIQAAPIPWRDVFARHDLGTRAGHEPEQTRPVGDAAPCQRPARLGSHRAAVQRYPDCHSNHPTPIGFGRSDALDPHHHQPADHPGGRRA
jgi:hypothetical protein